MLVPEALHPDNRYLSPQTRVRRARRLGTPGQVLVAEGDPVELGDVVAEAALDGPVRVLDAAQALAVAPDRVRDLLQVEVGASVQAGQLLARRGGLRRRTLVAPIAGTLLLVDEQGRLVLRGEPRREQVRALIQGTVVRVMAGEGVEIEGQGALLQGVWGNGQAGYGLLQLMVQQPNASAPAGLINAGVRGTIVVVGATVDAAGLRNAREHRVQGLIAGSMDASLLALALEMPYPILLLEGFGPLAIEGHTYGLLERLTGRQASLNAAFRHGPTRPELFVPLSGLLQPMPYDSGPLAAGDRVRLLSPPYLGQLGTVFSSTGQRVRLPSGITVPACKVQLDRGESVLVPFPNLERLLQ